MSLFELKKVSVCAVFAIVELFRQLWVGWLAGQTLCSVRCTLGSGGRLGGVALIEENATILKVDAVLW